LILLITPSISLLSSPDVDHGAGLTDNTCGQAQKGDLKYPSMQRPMASQVMYDRLLEPGIGTSLAD
jgi:hypothetical protein